MMYCKGLSLSINLIFLLGLWLRWGKRPLKLPGTWIYDPWSTVLYLTIALLCLGGAMVFWEVAWHRIDLTLG